MHGRLKVKTTEEQQKAKAAERLKKLKLYNAATGRAFQKRKAGELDEELLDITGQVLQLNPDFYTFWNIRKETFLSLNSSMASEQLQKRYQTELDFLEMCLKVNPKSYGTWHHRCFVLDHMPQADWKRELDLCNLFLQYDERNFHCWDYRRFVVRRSGVSAREEFDFTTSKISSNFSNFSSWHYRSKLLPLLHPDPTQPSGIDRDIIQSEFELVQNGLYTDPDDQSNWFYHKWLLGRGEKQQQINAVSISRGRKQILLSFTCATQMHADSCRVLVNSCPADVRWVNHRGDRSFSTLWIGDLHDTELDSCEGDGDTEVQIQVVAGESQVCGHTLLLPAGKEEASFQRSSADLSNFFRRELSSADETTLLRELEMITQLQEVETDNKWALLTMVLLMKAVDAVRHQERIQSLLQGLQSLDSPRRTYYQDLCSRFTVETALETSTDLTSLTLRGKQLSAVYRCELLPLLRHLDLSDNVLTHLPGFRYLQSLRTLNLSGNKLNSCSGVRGLRQLQHLDISNNCIRSVTDILSLQTCERLQELNLSGNSVCDDPCLTDKLQELFPNVQTKLLTTS